MPLNELDIRIYSKFHKRYLDTITLISFYARFVTGIIDDITVDIDFDNVVLEQFTGLKDKNGKEIYDGDIVKVVKISVDQKVYVAKVVFQEFGRYGFAVLIDYGKEQGSIYYGLWELESIEVVGNINENGWLLK